MIHHPEHGGYWAMSDAELLSRLGAERPTVCEDWPTMRAATGLRAIQSGLLPYLDEGVEVHALIYPDGTMMVSAAVIAAWKVGRA